MKTPENIEAIILLNNNAPLDKFLGLSAIEIDHLIYNTYNRNSPVQLIENIENQALDAIPLFRILEEYLKIILREKHIKLTPLGALQKKVIVELYDKRILLDDYIESGLFKLWKEDDCISIKSTRLTAELAGLVRKSNGKLTLTKKAIKLIENNNRSELFRIFFQTFTDKFAWSYNDDYPEQPIGQLGWAFSIIMLEKFGGQMERIEFYAEKYLKAFPNFINFFDSRHTPKEMQFLRCYGTRTFDRFFLWFGFVEIEKHKEFLDIENDTFKRTDWLNKIFKIDI